MNQMFKEECLRVFTGRPFYIALILGIALCMFGMFEAGLPGQFYDQSAFRSWQHATGSGGGAIFGGLVPFIAALPFTDSYALDWNSGYLRSVLTRTARKSYMRAKWIANALMGGLAVSFSMLIALALAYLLYPNTPPVNEPIRGAFHTLIDISPILYALTICGIGFLFGAAYASMGLACSLHVTNRYVVLAIPFLFYTLASFILAIMGLVIEVDILSALEPPSTLFPDHVENSTWWTMLGELGLIWSASVAYWCWGLRRKEVMG